MQQIGATIRLFAGLLPDQPDQVVTMLLFKRIQKDERSVATIAKK